jgi:hypothetical protein
MSPKKIVVGAAVLLAVAALAVFLFPHRNVSGQEAAAGLAKGFAGKSVEVYFKDQEPRLTGFTCIFSLDATVESVNDTGLFLNVTKKWTRNTYWAEKSDPRVEDSVGEDYKHHVFVPWSAVKYVKIAK